MGKEGGSWIGVLKKAIHAHIHGDIDEDIVRFPHLPHKKVQAGAAPPTATSSSASSSSSLSRKKPPCSCSCGHAHAAVQTLQVDGSARSVDSNSSGGSSRSISLSDCRSSSGSCSMTCNSTTNSRRISSLGDRRPPTEEPMLHFEDETEVNETIATLVNLWGPH
ncbi:hypothetical protein MPTK1_6g03350 [Marchantia polymorpha subsp. ruderalis]|uniref:Uncharacterized protein n=2 Tax=Marchantia polymorpha TaxID=3197 RepID=A0AAF6BN41_MARPO|nr:hypothetical protein MARPO_0035s0115 [Marchantia polymorpha]BBN13425.1 hypothetical protein Mp_6g03350 [Marchantia polymorpha subsp. ruderalis]|eukprot:PTQ41346.1 hypothetical protein MARPO_0035s0115 [Marchantia polymorpha]